MTTTAERVKQDMPPKGGYRKINVARVYPKPFASSKYTSKWILTQNIKWIWRRVNEIIRISEESSDIETCFETWSILFIEVNSTVTIVAYLMTSN